MASSSAPSRGSAAASSLALALVILAAGHLLLYVLLTGEARSALAAMEGQRSVAALEHARDPGPAPQPGGQAYSTWLRAYETWWASKDHALHSRHEGLVKTGMFLSFLIGLGLLGQGMVRASRTRGIPPRSRMAPLRPARAVPLRPVPALAVTARSVAVRTAAVRPVAVRPITVQRRRSA